MLKSLGRVGTSFAISRQLQYNSVHCHFGDVVLGTNSLRDVRVMSNSVHVVTSGHNIMSNSVGIGIGPFGTALFHDPFMTINIRYASS